jgi:hypothetical protein
MTVARIIAITAVVCAAIGMTTQAEAAKRKSTGTMTFTGCADWDLVKAPLCGPVMKDIAGNLYAFTPYVWPWIPLEVKARKVDIYVGPCRGATVMNVISVERKGSCGVSAR